VHYTMQNVMTEFSLRSGSAYKDPFNEVELDVAFETPDGDRKVVPAFWAGGNVWRVRYASPIVGKHSCRTICSDTSNADLHGRESVVEVTPYEGDNQLYRHGPLRVAESKRHLEHRDGTPFFWLGDTWWMGLCKRLKWPAEFQALTADRIERGFSLIQIVAGLYPDMGPFDPRGLNEAGFPWEKDWLRVNPAYFDMADLRIGWLVDAGLVPCIVGCWGYYMDFAGREVLKKHWRYLVARWGAYPVVWCVAGEALMFWYLRAFKNDDQRKAAHQEFQSDWIEVANYLRSVDPYSHPVTAHPGGRGAREMLGDGPVDIEMLQTGHGGHGSMGNTVNQISESFDQQPKMPVVNGEVSYEGIGGSCWEDVQRFMFWAGMLCGAAGHTYGANGMWQMSTEEDPYGPSPHGMSWGNTPWKVAAQLSGSRQVGIGRRLLERYEWWRLQPTPDAVQPRWSPLNYYGPYAATVPGRCVIVYMPRPCGSLTLSLEPEVSYHAFLFNPANGEEYDIGAVRADQEGKWTSPGALPVYHDLVLVVERTGA